MSPLPTYAIKGPKCFTISNSPTAILLLLYNNNSKMLERGSSRSQLPISPNSQISGYAPQKTDQGRERRERKKKTQKRTLNNKFLKKRKEKGEFAYVTVERKKKKKKKIGTQERTLAQKRGKKGGIKRTPLIVTAIFKSKKKHLSWV